MQNAISKKQLILECSQAHGYGRIGLREIRSIDAELRRLLGADERTSPSYIANILRESGALVEYDDRFVDPWMEEPYMSRLKGALEFRDLASAEASLERLDAIYRDFREASDRIGTSLVRELVMKGRQRAESMSANPRLGPEKRREKKEIAEWFRVWLQISDLFFEWLELRKETDEFKRLFPSHDGEPAPRARRNGVAA